MSKQKTKVLTTLQPSKTKPVSLFAEGFLLPHESQAEYHQLREQLAADMKAEGTAEQMIIEQLAQIIFRMKRLDEQEAVSFILHNTDSFDSNEDSEPFIPPIIPEDVPVKDKPVCRAVRDEWGTANAVNRVKTDDIWRVRSECPVLWYNILYQLSPAKDSDSPKFLLDCVDALPNKDTFNLFCDIHPDDWFNKYCLADACQSGRVDVFADLFANIADQQKCDPGIKRTIDKINKTPKDRPPLTDEGKAALVIHFILDKPNGIYYFVEKVFIRHPVRTSRAKALSKSIAAYGKSMVSVSGGVDGQLAARRDEFSNQRATLETKQARLMDEFRKTQQHRWQLEKRQQHSTPTSPAKEPYDFVSRLAPLDTKQKLRLEYLRKHPTEKPPF